MLRTHCVFVMLALVLPMFGSVRLLAAQETIAPPSAAEIADAIARGIKSKKWEGGSVRPSRISIVGDGFEVTLEGPLNRVAIAAGKHAGKYLPFTVDSIPAGLLDATITIVATPNKQVRSTGRNGQNFTPPATHAVLAAQHDGQMVIVQPTSMELFDAEVTGIAEERQPAPVFKTKGIRATFPMSAVLRGEFVVKIVTEKKEFELKLDKKERGEVR